MNNCCEIISRLYGSFPKFLSRRSGCLSRSGMLVFSALRNKVIPNFPSSVHSCPKGKELFFSRMAAACCLQFRHLTLHGWNDCVAAIQPEVTHFHDTAAWLVPLPSHCCPRTAREHILVISTPPPLRHEKTLSQCCSTHWTEHLHELLLIRDPFCADGCHHGKASLHGDTANHVFCAAYLVLWQWYNHLLELFRIMQCCNIDVCKVSPRLSGLITRQAFLFSSVHTLRQKQAKEKQCDLISDNSPGRSKDAGFYFQHSSAWGGFCLRDVALHILTEQVGTQGAILLSQMLLSLKLCLPNKKKHFSKLLLKN